MSNEFMFGVRSQKPSREIAHQLDAIAKSHGFQFVEANLADGYKAWFAGPNRGHPFDQRAQMAIEADIKAAGL